MLLAAGLALALAAGGDFIPPRGHTLEELRVRFGIRIVIQDVGLPLVAQRGVVSGADASQEDLRRYALVLGTELGLYPPELVRWAGLRAIVLCRDLELDGERCIALAEYASGTLYVDVTRAADDPRFQRRCIHHEFYHFIDCAEDMQLDADDAWSAFNPPGFRYADGTAAESDPTESLWTEEHAGFVSRYGRTAVFEDKAELWSFALVHPRELAERARVDLVLAAKLERMRAGVRSHASRIDGVFWNRLSLLERHEPDRLEDRTPR